MMPLPRRPLHRFLREDRAAALVEFAIVVSLLLLLAFGAIDWGRYLYQRTNLINTVREGARYGAVLTPENEATVEAYTTGRVVGIEKPANVVIDAGYSDVGTTRMVTVKATYAYQPAVPFLMGNSKAICVLAQFRVEQPGSAATSNVSCP